MFIEEVAEAICASPRDIENWIGRLELSTKFAPAGRGRPRVYSKENAIELGFIAAIVRGGVEPSKAAAYARSMLGYLKFDNLREWLIFRAGDIQKAVALDKLDFATVFERLKDAKAAPTYSIVHLGEVVRRVERAAASEERG